MPGGGTARYWANEVREIMATRIEDRPALNRAGVYAIHDQSTGKFAGKILFAHPKDGTGKLYVSMWDFTPVAGREVQNGYATGYGYDKQSAALDGMTFGTANQEFTRDCDGTGMETVREQFAAHGYTLQWLV